MYISIRVTSVVNLVCDKNDVSGTFKFVRHHEKIYVSTDHNVYHYILLVASFVVF